MGGKTSSSTSSVQIPPEVLARYNAVNEYAGQVAQTPYQPYGGQFVAPMTSTQNAAITNINQAAGQAQPYFTGASQALLQGQQSATPYYNAAMKAYGGAYDIGANLGQQSYGAITNAQAGAQPYNQLATGLALAGTQAVNPNALDSSSINQYMSPYLGTVLGSAMSAMNQQNALQQSQLAGNAIHQGAFGGDRSGVAAANLAYQQNLANQQTIANLLNTGYGQALSTAQQQQGLGLSAQQANRAALAGGANQLLGVGQQQFGQGAATAQQLAGLGQQQFGQGLTAGQQIAGLGQGVYGMGQQTAQNLAALGTGAQGAALQGAQAQMAAGTQQQQTQQALNTALYNQYLQQQGYPFQVAQFLAGIAEGTGALSGSTTTSEAPASFFSDRRLKENVKEIGETFDGQPIYRYNYKGHPGTQIGLMAQDVEHHHPEAVGLAGGYKTVDYDRATDDAAHRGHFAYGGSSMGGGVMPEHAGEGFAYGGASDDDVYPYGSSIKGLGIPSVRPATRGLQTAQTPQQGPSDFQQLVGGLGTIGAASTGIGSAYEGGKKLLGFLGFSSGGLVPRGGYAEGGGPDDDFIPPSEGDVYSRREAMSEFGHRSPPTGWAPPGPLSFEEAQQFGAQTPYDALGSALKRGFTGLFPAASNPAAPGSAAETLAEVGRAIVAPFSSERLYPGAEPPSSYATQQAPGASEATTPEVRSLVQRILNEPPKAGVAPPVGPARDVPARPVTPGSVPASAGVAPTTMRQGTSDLGAPSVTAAPPVAPGQTPTAVSEGAGKGGVGDWFSRNQSWLVPLLTGVGTMAASPSRYLGAAILQGVGGAAGAYEKVQNEMAQRAKIAAETGQVQATTARGAFTPIPGLGPVVSVKDPKTGNVIPMQQSEYRRRVAGGERLDVVGIPAGTPTGEGPTAQPIAPTQPSNINGVVFNPTTAQSEDISGANYEDMVKQSGKYMDNVRSSSEAARGSRFNTLEAASTLANAISSGDKNALSTPGAYAAERAQIANMANTFGRMIGVGDIAGPADTNAAILGKLNNAMAGQVVSAADERSLQALRMALTAQPGIAMSPDAAAELASQALIHNQRMIDKNTHLDQYVSNSPQGTAYNAAKDFDSTNSQDKYNREQQAFKTIMMNPNGAKAINLMKSGSVSPQQMEDYLYRNTGIRGLSRYFTSGG